MDTSSFLFMLTGLIVFSPTAEAWTMASKEMNVLRVFEQKISREIYGLMNGQSWRIRTNKQIQDLLQEEDIVKLIKLLRFRWHGYTGRMNNERMPKKVVTTRMEGVVKTGRPRKRWSGDVEENFNGDKKLAYSDQRPGGMKEYYIGYEGTQWIVALGEEVEDNF